MLIPKNTVSPSQLRMYGSADVRTEDQEDDRGCPRRWKARYVDGIKDTSPSYPLRYGSLFHRVMERVVSQDVDPREAILSAVDDTVTVEMVDELLQDLENYLARPAADTDEMATLGTEVDLTLPLYVDPKAGQMNLRVIIDWLGMDPDDPNTIHVKDYKSNRSPISHADLAGDVQMRAYAWAVMQVISRWVPDPENARVIIHMDLVKFRDYVVEYSADELDAWQTWAEALTRTILRDEKALPVINTNCASCVVRGDCPALQALPDTVRALATTKFDAEKIAEGRRWRDDANAARLTIEKVVTAWDEAFGRYVLNEGPVTIDSKAYTMEPKEESKVDVFAVAALLGDGFPEIASVTKAAVERSKLDASTKAQVLACWSPEITGRKLVARKITT